MKDKNNKSIAVSEDVKEKWNLTEEELRQGEEEGNVEELSEGKEEEDTRSLSDLKNDPDIANKWHNARTGETTEEELLEKAGGKWKEEESEADKIGKAVAKHLNESQEEEEAQTEELEEGQDRQEAPRQEGSKELPPEWKDKLAQQGGNWINEEELQEAQEEEEGSILSEIKENTTVEELNSGKKRIDTTSVRAISEINSLNYEYPNYVNILHTDNEKGSMTAIVDPSIKQKLN